MSDTTSIDAWFADHDAELAGLRGSRPGSVEGEVDADRALLRLLYEAGWTLRGWPQAVGGAGGDEIDRARLYDAIERADLRLPEVFVLLETLGPVLVRYAPQIAARHLDALLRGEEIWAQGFSEPEAGSDLASVRTTGTLAGERLSESLSLSGQKVWTTLGQCAQWAMVLCRTDQDAAAHRGLSMVWVDLSAPGVDVRPIQASNGRNEFAEMFFTDVRVPLDQVIGGLGKGWAVAMYLLQFERGMYAWGRQAALHRSLRQGIRAAARDGRAPGDAALTACGRAFTTLSALRARSARTVSRLAGSETLGPEASIDKVLLSRAEQQTLDALRLLSGPAFLLDDGEDAAELRANWFYSRATSIFGGAVEIQRGIIAERLMGLPKEVRHGR